MLLRNIFLSLLLLSLLLFSGCMSQTRFDLSWQKSGETKKYSFSCDKKEDLLACQAAEALLSKPDQLKGSKLNLPGCPNIGPKKESSLVKIKGRIKKKDVNALFYDKTSLCQDKRWNKLTLLLQTLEPLP